MKIRTEIKESTPENKDYELQIYIEGIRTSHRTGHYVQNVIYKAELEVNGINYVNETEYSKYETIESIEYQKGMLLHRLFFSNKEVHNYAIKEVLKDKDIRNRITYGKPKLWKKNEYVLRFTLWLNDKYLFQEFEIDEETKEIIRQIEEQEYIEEQMKNF